MAASQPHLESAARGESACIEWTLADLLESAGIAAANGPSDLTSTTIINRLTVDSRDADGRSCFVALAGTRTDGHRFVEQTLDQGAAAVVVEADRCKVQDDRVIAVADSHVAVGKLAATFYGIDRLQRDGKLRLIGVTGTNGKTTVVSLITSILRAAGLKASSLGTIGLDVPGGSAVGHASVISGMTTPPPIELCAALAHAARAGAECVAMEVSSHALDQCRTDGLRFDVGVFTNLTQDHLDYHGDMERYARAKRRLFDGLDSQATAVINSDDLCGSLMTSQCPAPIIAFSSRRGNVEVSATNVQLSACGTTFELHVEGQRATVTSKLIGSHNVSNMLAAVSTAHAMGVKLNSICDGIASIDCVPGRLERIDCGDAFDVFVDYAHTPDALENVLRVLRDVTRGRLICVFGCGGDRDKSKRIPMARAVQTFADIGIVTSDNPRNEDPNAIIADVVSGFDGVGAIRRIVQIDRRVAIMEAIRLAEKNDTVLIAGKGHEDYQIIGDERRNFDDRQVAREVSMQLRESAKQAIEVTA